MAAKSNIVYKYTCACNATYIGKTTQRFSERIKQHVPESVVGSSGKLNKARNDSAILVHLKSEAKCRPKKCVTDRFEVLAPARDQNHLDVLEAMYIRSFTPVLCLQKEHVKALHLFSA